MPTTATGAKVGGVLSEIRITGLGVIDDAMLCLSEGFTVVTGETGAGKTMVVAGLGLMFGGRADPARVRPGLDKAVIEGRIKPPTDNEFGNALVALGLDLPEDLEDDDTLLIARTVHANGRSRGHVGGRSAPVSFLAELGERLVALHGQADQLRLLRPSEQRAALDTFGGAQLQELLARHRELFAQWQTVAGELADRRAQARERAHEADLLRHGLNEVEAAAPQPGEDVEVRAEIDRLQHAEALRTAAFTAHQALVGDPVGDDVVDVSGLLGTTRRVLTEQAHHDKELADFAQRADEIVALAGELGSNLASYVESIEADPARLASLQDRLAVLTGLTRKYGENIDHVLMWADQARIRLDALDDSVHTVAALTAQQDQLASELAATAQQLSAARAKAAGTFSAAVTQELTGLAMPHAEIVVNLARRTTHNSNGQPTIEIDTENVAIGADGIDEVELALRPHPGGRPLPLQKGASGGELSRIMLAIEVVFAGVAAPTTMIFDEVDAGVGGKAAVEIGRRLAQLATTHQVLAVTHLPQVAAFADRHIVVIKDDDGSVTTSGLRNLDETERVKELARMLAGLEESDLGLAHAQELLTMAQGERAGFATSGSARSA